MIKIFQIIYLTQVFLVISSGLIAQNAVITESWDQKIIEEATIWKKLLTHYSMANKTLYWTEREQSLNKVLNEFPKSQWTDDAALLLAGEKVLRDHSWDKAVIDLREIMKKYPNESTIIDNWDAYKGCHISKAWLLWAPSRVIFNEEESLKTDFPFNRDGKIDILEKEALAYFEHLEKYPQRTRDVAQYMIALILHQNGKFNEAILELEMLLANYPDLSKIRIIDFDASKRENGHLIGNEPPFDALPIWRIQYSASILLINLYIKQNRIEEAITIGSKLVQQCSPDGWYWNINEFVGNIYATNNLPTLAYEQYDKSINGIKEKSKIQAIRMDALLSIGNAMKPENFVTWDDVILKSNKGWIDKIENSKKKLYFNK
ncbi:MAG TPA: tetratricopeptide repeat protein [Prolixibacteraceae bacterium]|nr:tetratricopeptide repeat protein [Prolixibacteraceae bacterium]